MEGRGMSHDQIGNHSLRVSASTNLNEWTHADFISAPNGEVQMHFMVENRGGYSGPTEHYVGPLRVTRESRNALAKFLQRKITDRAGLEALKKDTILKVDGAKPTILHVHYTGDGTPIFVEFHGSTRSIDQVEADLPVTVLVEAD